MSELFETTDMALAERLLTSSYGTVRIAASGQRHGMRLTRACLGPVRLDQLSFAMSFNAHVAPLGALVFCEVTSGRISRDSDGSHRAYGPGDVCLAAEPDHPHTTAVEDTGQNVAVIDAALPSQVAETAPDWRQQPVRFTSYDAVSPAAARLWRATYAYIRDMVLADPDTAVHPLVAGSAARLLTATAVAVFPNNTLTDPTIEDRHDAHPATLRRAVAFIEENAHRDITVADIAAAAFVTIRAVQLAFRRHLGTTPLAYLRRVRIARAHQDLKNASHGDGTTVTAVAYRWGFNSSSRFAAHYRQAYGVTPSCALDPDRALCGPDVDNRAAGPMRLDRLVPSAHDQS